MHVYGARHFLCVRKARGGQWRPCLPCDHGAWGGRRAGLGGSTVDMFWPAPAGLGICIHRSHASALYPHSLTCLELGERLMTLGNSLKLYQMRNQRYLKNKEVPKTTFKRSFCKPNPAPPQPIRLKNTSLGKRWKNEIPGPENEQQVQRANHWNHKGPWRLMFSWCWNSFLHPQRQFCL